MRKPTACGFLLISQQTLPGTIAVPFAQDADGTWIFTGTPPASDISGNTAFPFALVGDLLYLGNGEPAVDATALPQVSTAATPSPAPPGFSPAPEVTETSTSSAAPAPTPLATATASPMPAPLGTTGGEFQVFASASPQAAVTTSAQTATASPAAPSPLPQAAYAEPAPTSAVFHQFAPETRYYYHQLTATEKAVFATVYDGIMNFNDTIRFSPVCTEQELDRVMFVIYNDCPELMQLSPSYTKHYRDANSYFGVSPQYDMDAAQVQTALRESLAVVEQMQFAADFGATDLSKELSVYRSILARTGYSIAAPYCDRANGPLLEKQGKCDGYAKALTLALRYYGIPCTIVCGESFELASPQDTEEHCWNYVYIGQQWYQCDPTWDDTDDDLPSDPPDFLPFFNLTDDRMFLSRTLQPSFAEWSLPVCDGTAAYYYTDHGVLLRQGDNFADALALSLTQAYQNKTDYAAIAVESQTEYILARNALQDEMTNWRFQGVRIQAYTYTYTDEGLVLYLYELAFTP